MCNDAKRYARQVTKEILINMQYGFIYHVLPRNDFIEHINTDYTCWCKPVLNDEGIYVHNSLDGRELIENGERLIQ